MKQDDDTVLLAPTLRPEGAWSLLFDAERDDDDYDPSLICHADQGPAATPLARA